MLWYPYAQMKTMNAPYQIVAAKGPYLYTAEKKLIDSVASWWCAIYGYNHPALNQAICRQVEQFSHIMLGGLTHEPARQLADKLAQWLPGDLDYCFFSDSGSVAVEVALKMAYQYYANNGENRPHVLSLKNAYHGDTFKAMEVSNVPAYHGMFPRGDSVIHIFPDEESLEQAFARYGRTACCFIAEPLLQGAGGMKTYDLAVLRRARQLCDHYGVLLIFDEVATGFGRTGYRFVADVVLPDILVLGKALTGGYIGHGATITCRRVFEGFYNDDARYAFMHGPTFMGNPLACSAALAAIDLFEAENCLQRVQHIESLARRELNSLSDRRIRDIRILGACICIETFHPADLSGYQEFAYRRGVFSRPFLNCLYAMPPYILSDEDLLTVISVMKEWFQRRL